MQFSFFPIGNSGKEFSIHKAFKKPCFMPAAGQAMTGGACMMSSLDKSPMLILVRATHMSIHSTKFHPKINWNA